MTAGEESVQSKMSIPDLAPLEAVLFDIDGTLCDSDPIHYIAFCKVFEEIGMEVPDDEFLGQNMSGKHNDDIAAILFPDDIPKGMKFMEDMEAMFRRLASENLPSIKGLYKLTKWIEDRGLKRAAVTNAPKLNAELMISKLGLHDFFDAVIVGSDCERAKPYPDPYLKALQVLQVSKDHTIVCEDSLPGIQAGVAAGLPVVGLTTTYPENLLMEANPTILIKDYEDPKLWDYLEQLDNKREEVLEKHPLQFPNNLGHPTCKHEEQETLLLDFENQTDTNFVRQTKAFVQEIQNKDFQTKISSAWCHHSHFSEVSSVGVYFFKKSY